MTRQIVDVVLRCKNEMPYVVPTLRALQQAGHRLLFVDSGSTDGSKEIAERAGLRILSIAAESYIPGAVLNLGMRLTESPIVAFVNADAIPQTTDAVDALVKACSQGAAAAYGRQVPRKNARSSTPDDYARACPGEGIVK